MALFFPPIQAFSAAANPAEDWSDWKKSFTIYERATKYHKEDDETRIALLLHVGGAELVQKYHAFTFPAAQQKFADVLQRFDKHFERYRNTTHASYVFHNLKQSKDQTFEAFAQAVEKQADQCAFGEARNRMITDRLVHGINDNSLRERLLREKKLTLDKVKDQCMAAQLSRTYAQEMQPQSPEVFAIHRRGPPTSRQYDATREPSEGAPTHRQPPQPRHNSQRTCSRCGQFHQPRQCPAFGQQCYNCGKPNHYAALCQQQHQPRPLQSRHAHVVRELQEDAPLSLDVLTVRTVQHSSSWSQRVNVSGHDIVFKLDTGSDVNLISTEQFQKLPDPPPLNSPGACVTTYTGEPLPLRGECFLRCSVPGTSATLKFCIVDMSTAAILGLDACRELKLIQLNRLKCNSVDGTTGRDDTPEVCFLEQSSAMALPSKPKKTQSLTAHSCQDLSHSASEDQPSNRVLSSAESLRQITLQLNGLMNDTNAALNGDIAALADSSGAPRNDALLRRNQELATSLESLQQDRDQLEFQLQELRGKLTRQQREFEREQQEREDQSRRELGAINDQLQVHIQTIGILVAEKTELQSALSQSQQTAKQKAVETEELQGRLKAARERNTDLERKLNSVNSQSQVQEKSSQEYLREIERLKTEQYKSSKSIEELKQELSELSNKLGKKAKDNEALQQELGDVKKELSLAQLYAQQLGGAQASENVHSQLEELHQEKLDMEKKVNKFKDAMEQIAAEKQQMSSHYQSYVDRLSQQLETSKAMVEKLTQEKVELEKKAVELESRPLPSSVPAPETEELKLRLEQCQRELDSLRSSSEAQANDNQQLSLLVAEREARAEELERQLARIKEDHVESSRLLETIQSDKVAASRALSQNKELKRQLEEMQDVFVKLSNDKLELTEQLQKEQHVTKELGERLGQQEDELKELRDQLAVKEDKVHDLEQLSTKDMYQQSQLADRMRHYQAQCQLTEILQQELSQAQARTSALVTQNSDLRKALAERAQMAVDVNEKDSGKVHDLVGSLSASVQQLELERDQLVRQLDEQKGQRETLQHQLIELKQSEDSLLSQESEEVSRESYAKLRAAMQKLEERFKATMDQIADLSDQKQQLEHLVTQLQGETDTIADYIALYQVQRGIMRKRAAEKDDYISQLAKDREDLKAKLSELQCLIVRLLEERQQQHPTQSLPPLPGKALTLASFSSSMAGSPDAGDSGRGEAPTTNGNGGQPEDDETAQKIMHLLTEIETSGAVEGSPVPDTFHPCPVCSGRLLTV